MVIVQRSLGGLGVLVICVLAVGCGDEADRVESEPVSSPASVESMTTLVDPLARLVATRWSDPIEVECMLPVLRSEVVESEVESAGSYDDLGAPFHSAALMASLTCRNEATANLPVDVAARVEADGGSPSYADCVANEVFLQFTVLDVIRVEHEAAGAPPWSADLEGVYQQALATCEGSE